MPADPLQPPAEVPGAELEALYRGPLEDFTGTRDELAARLRSEGEREAAAWVKGLRKPSQAAWITNQLAASDPSEVESLLDAGRRLRELQEGLLGGKGDPEALRAAAAQERSAVERLRSAAAGIAAREKAGPAALDRVGETLQAAAGDPEVAEALRLGRLTREERASSIGLAGAAGAGPAARGSGAKGGRGKGDRAKGEERPKGTRARDREAERDRAARELERRRKAAQRSVAAAERKLESERAATERAREALAERQGKLAEARRALSEARRELKRVR